MRGALNSDELAPLAIEALVRSPSAEVQKDLANLAVADRPVPVRTQAAAALVAHIQAFGRFVTAAQADAIEIAAGMTEDADLKAKLLAAQGILKADAKGTGERLRGFVPRGSAEPPKEDPAKKE
jgi:hypothetical protein